MAYFDIKSATALVRIYKQKKYPAVEGAETIGRMNVWHGSVVQARELGLKTIIELQLTCDTDDLTLFPCAAKWIYNPGQVDNYASIWLHDGVGTRYITSGIGSVWVNFHSYGQ